MAKEIKIMIGGYGAYNKLLQNHTVSNESKKLLGRATVILENEKESILFLHIEALDDLEIFPNFNKLTQLPKSSDLLIDVTDQLNTLLEN